ncbi:PucR C-terminal helix-turn-helix domain-containing protein [Ruaniaceae bacterium KH17]|nr:PucR C-terminal helix-turn-helix domain-containing protein [Ruaniaceae bacterium KH17]
MVSTELYGAEWSVVGAGAYVKRRAGSRLIASQETETIAQLEADAVMLRRACLYPGLFPTLAIEQGRASRGVWQWGIAEAIAHMPPRSLARLARRVAELSPEHCRTVLTLGQHSSAHAAAKELYVHRNTFTQRMDQIQLRTGADPRVGDELAELLLSIYARAAMGDLHIFDAS